MSPDTFCEERAAPPGSALHYALRVVPLAPRRALLAIHAFAAEARAAVTDAHDPDVARARIAWWREELRRAFEGEPQHPVARALLPAARAYDLAEEPFQQILDGADLDLAPDRLADAQSWRQYLHHTGGVPAQLAAQVLGYADRRTLEYAAEAGLALELARVIGDLGADLQAGRRYLPRDLLARHAVSDGDLRRATPAAGALLRELVGQARALMAGAEHMLPAVDRRRQRAGLAQLALARALLDEIDRDPLQVLRARIALTPIRKLWIAWKCTTFTR